MKYDVVSDLGRWLALLLIEEESLSKEEKAEIVCNALRSYTRWVRKLWESLSMKRETLKEIK